MFNKCVGFVLFIFCLFVFGLVWFILLGFFVRVGLFIPGPVQKFQLMQWSHRETSMNQASHLIRRTSPPPVRSPPPAPQVQLRSLL